MVKQSQWIIQLDSAVFQVEEVLTKASSFYRRADGTGGFSGLSRFGFLILSEKNGNFLSGAKLTRIPLSIQPTIAGCNPVS